MPHNTVINSTLQDYLQRHQDRFITELFDLLRIPSISTLSNHTADVLAAAEFVQQKLLEAGMDKAQIIPTAGHPLVYAEKIVDPKFPTVLVYGHYDVQPADPYDLWETPPFEPTIRNGKIYARGASDDKGQLYIHIKAVEAMLAVNQLSCNVKFLIEGEEEAGCQGIIQFLKNPINQTLLKADALLIADTSLVAMDNPHLPIGLRGILYAEITVTSAGRDLHSGMYGGAVSNPIQVLCTILSALKNQSNRIMIPGFYDKVQNLSIKERNAINTPFFDLHAYKKSIDILDIVGEEGYSTRERIWIRPSLDINGIWGGYIEEGAKTVLPAQAHAKLSMRLVPFQQVDEVIVQLRHYLKTITPDYVHLSIKIHEGGGNPILFDHTIPAFQAANQAFQTVWGKSPIWARGGGSIPVVTTFKETLCLDSVLMGFGLDTDAIHAPNENFGVENFIKGMETVIAFYHHFSEAKTLPVHN